MVLAPVLPSLAVGNSTREVLDEVTAWLAGTTNVSGTITRSARAPNITRAIAGSARAADITRSIARSTRSADVTRTVPRCARSANVTGPIAWLAWATNIARPTATWLSGATEVSSTAGPSRQLGRDVARTRTASGTRKLARTIAEKLGGSAACECTAGTSDCASTES
jgi:hypothetical protein